MSNINTTISINAVDNTSAAFSKLEQNAGKVYQNILQQANKNAKLGQDTLKQIEKEVDAYKRKQQIQLEGQKALLRQELESTYSKESISDRRKSIQAQEKEDLSKTINVTEKSQIRKKYQGIYSNFDSDVQTEKKADEKQLESTFKGFEEEQKNTNLLLKDLVEGLKSDIFSKLENKSKAAINEDAREVLGGGGASLSDSERAARIAAAKGGDDKKEKSLYEKIRNAAIVAYVGHKIGEVAHALAGAEDSETFVADALSGIPIVGAAISTAQKRHLQESLQQDKARNALRGTLGRGGGVNSLAGEFGMDLSETLPIAQKLAVAQHSGININSRTRGLVGAEKAFNLDENVLMQTASINSWNRDSDTNSVAKTVGMVASILGTRGELKSGSVDTTRLELLMQANNTLAEDQLTVLEEADNKSTVGVLKAFNSLGGRYSDPSESAKRIMQINNALKSPSNEFQQARNFAVLSELNPNASYFELQKEQSKGIYSKGVLSKTLNMTEQQYGTGDMGKMALMSQFGFSPDQAEKFMSGYKKDRTMFDNMGEEGISNYLSEGDINRMGSANVTKRQKEQAVISDAFGKGAWDGVVAVGESVAKELKGSWDKVISVMKVMGMDNNSAKQGVTEPAGALDPNK